MIKKYFLPTLIVLLFLLSAVHVYSENAENLLYNADFTELDEDNLPAEWYTDAYILDPGYTVFSLQEMQGEHTKAVCVQNIGSNDARFAQTVEVEPDSVYKLSGYILAEGVENGLGANLSVEGVYAFSDSVYDTEGAWQYIEYYGETGPDQEFLTVFARLGGYSGESKGKAYFADLSLIRVDSVPGDQIADLWYRETDSAGDDEENAEEGEPGQAWPWMLFVGLAYVSAGLAAILILRRYPSFLIITEQRRRLFAALILIISLALRLLISYYTEGYMVDVNCFTSWGHTMASVGPTQFYQATNFCDYPPLYTYILGINSRLSGMLGGDQATARIVFRLIPSFCDVLASFFIYRLSIQEKHLTSGAGLLFLFFLAFNPATILNSAGWGQMDSVLCLLLLGVALCAIKKQWMVALPMYVISVLVKPQALMLGPLGLTYIVITLIRSADERRSILYGTVLSLLTLAAGVIPFSLQQNWDWLIQLYSRTLASYPYATVNTANFYYLLGGNWSDVGNAAPLIVSIVFALGCTAYGIYWYRHEKERPCFQIETGISLLFAVGFLICAFLKASWAWTGGLAMVFSFVIVLSPAVRSRNIRLLAYLGALLYILLYVFGVKMHERYLFPALLLLASAWVILKDRRILYLLLLFTLTLFLNEGIVLDNSIRLGSSLGHLNSDTVWLADLLSIVNCIGAAYAVWLSTELLSGRQTAWARSAKARTPADWSCDRKLHWNRKDTIILTSITAVYAIISLLTLGSTKAPQTTWVSSSPEEQIVFDLGEYQEDFEVLYFGQVSRYDFSVSVSSDGENWSEEVWAQMDQGQCWKWKYITESYTDNEGNHNYYSSDESHIIRFSGQYLRLSACQFGLRLNEILIRDRNGHTISPKISSRSGEEPDSELYSDPAALIDEPDTLEPLPSIPENNETQSFPIQPSWWNSTYFDEIYHARTGYEFLEGTVPYETSHPPLGKVLISLFISIFGMTPFGWRFAGALAGILMLPGMYLLGKQLTKRTPAATIACLLMALDCMHLTQTQIATIDSFPVLFILFAYFFMLRFLQTDFLRDKTSCSLIPLGCSGLFMGLSIASKWIGVYAGAGLAVLFFWHCFRIIRIHREPSGKDSARLHPALRKTIGLFMWCVLFFVIVPVLIYLLSYIPYMAYNAKRIHSLSDYIAEVWRSQIGMFNYHSTKALGMDHPFYSPWWEWPVIGKPMYYASQQYIPADFPVHYSIFCFGNPIIWYGGLAALGYCLIRMTRRIRYHAEGSDLLWHLKSTSYDSGYIFILIGFLAQYLPWVLVPRGTYIYHYFASLPFLMLGITQCFNGYQTPKQRIADWLGYAFLLASAVFFILLFPYASGMNVSADWLNIGKSLLKIWY